MKFRTLDYNALNYIIRKKHLKFKHDSQLNNYFAKRPKLIEKAMTPPLPFTEAISLAVRFYIPELRQGQGVKTYCQFYKEHWFQKPHLKLFFYIENANHRKKGYWLRLNNDIQHSQRIPFYMVSPIRYQNKPAWFRFYYLWTKYPYKLVYFYYINTVKKSELTRSIKLIDAGHHIKRHYQRINLIQEFKNKHIKKIRRTGLKNVACYKIQSKWYFIQSKDLIKRVRNR